MHYDLRNALLAEYEEIDRRGFDEKSLELFGEIDL